MKFYPRKITERLCNLKNAGRAEITNSVGTNATVVCGCALRFTLQIIEQRIIAAKFQTNGCGFALATAEFLAESIIGKELAELRGLENIEKLIAGNLGEFSPDREHCVELAVKTLRTALDDFRSHQLDEFVGEKALICACFGVSEETIEAIIGENSCDTVEEVSHLCNAGNGCGSCQPLIQEIIDLATDMI